MTQEREFERLEQFVNKLLVKFDQLRAENKQLEKSLLRKDSEISDLKNELSSADSARGDITSRVKGLIDQIEEWEAALVETDDVVTDTATDDTAEEEPVKEEQTGPQKEITSGLEVETTVVDRAEAAEESEGSEDAEVDKEGGQQQNLFNVEPSSSNMGG